MSGAEPVPASDGAGVAVASEMSYQAETWLVLREAAVLEGVMPRRLEPRAGYDPGEARAEVALVARLVDQYGMPMVLSEAVWSLAVQSLRAYLVSMIHQGGHSRCQRCGEVVRLAQSGTQVLVLDPLSGPEGMYQTTWPPGAGEHGQYTAVLVPEHERGRPGRERLHQPHDLSCARRA